jgi:hypothetical protein
VFIPLAVRFWDSVVCELPRAASHGADVAATHAVRAARGADGGGRSESSECLAPFYLSRCRISDNILPFAQSVFELVSCVACMWWKCTGSSTAAARTPGAAHILYLSIYIYTYTRVYIYIL